MKKLAVVILSTLIILGVFPETSTFIYFKINQTSIAKTHCEQKSNAETKCQGKCFLTKLIQKNSSNETPTNPSENKIEQVNVYYLKNEGLPYFTPNVSIEKYTHNSHPTYISTAGMNGIPLNAPGRNFFVAFSFKVNE